MDEFASDDVLKGFDVAENVMEVYVELFEENETYGSTESDAPDDEYAGKTKGGLDDKL